MSIYFLDHATIFFDDQSLAPFALLHPTADKNWLIAASPLTGHPSLAGCRSRLSAQWLCIEVTMLHAAGVLAAKLVLTLCASRCCLLLTASLDACH